MTRYVPGSTGIGATNAELFYNFQGLTRDGRFYITARLAVRHPKLPDSIDDPRTASDESEKTAKAEQRRVNSWPESSFYPALGELDAMMGSITVNR